MENVESSKRVRLGIKAANGNGLGGDGRRVWGMSEAARGWESAHRHSSSSPPHPPPILPGWGAPIARFSSNRAGEGRGQRGQQGGDVRLSEANQRMA